MKVHLYLLLLLVIGLSACQQSKSPQAPLAEQVQTEIAREQIAPSREASIGDNLLINSDFEAGLEAWTSCNLSEMSDFSLSGEARAGQNALHLGKNCFYQNLIVKTGDSLKLSCYAKLEQDSLWSGLGLSISSAKWRRLFNAPSMTISNQDYQLYETGLVAPANSYYASVWVYTDGSLLVDSCELKLENILEPPSSAQQICDANDNRRWGGVFTCPAIACKGSNQTMWSMLKDFTWC
ncbi:MAG: hypothetical protein R2880_15340 [Deinococcales bacterium]